MNEPLRILVADDDARMCEFYEAVLGAVGHTVKAAANGKELVELCSKLDPDLVITDVRMPRLDGLDAAGAINEQRPVPVIVVSAYHDTGLLERASAPYVHGYLVKPIKGPDLVAAIAVAMRRFDDGDPSETAPGRAS